jgi:Tol biopolymer transport system component
MRSLVLVVLALLTAGTAYTQEIFSKTEFTRFSPDGKQVVFSSAVYQASTTSGVPAKRLSARIAIMNVDGTKLKFITAETPGKADAIPVISGDSKKILFRRDNLKDGAESGDIFIVDVDGTGLTQLSKSPEHETNPEFAMDGKGVVFIREYFTGLGKAKDGELVWVDLKGGGEKIMIPKEMRVLQATVLNVGRGGYLLACAETDTDGKPLPAGSMLAMASPDGEINPRSKMVPQASKKVRIFKVHTIIADGKPVFYINGREGEGWFADDIHFKVTTGQIQKITTKGYYGDINISPDGKTGVQGGDSAASIKLWDFSDDKFSNKRIVTAQ